MAFAHVNLPLSLNAGATFPGQCVRDIAAAANMQLYYGNEGHYGSDYMGLPADPDESEIVQALLTEAKIHWQLVDELPYNMRYMAS